MSYVFIKPYKIQYIRPMGQSKKSPIIASRIGSNYGEKRLQDFLAERHQSTGFCSASKSAKLPYRFHVPLAKESIREEYRFYFAASNSSKVLYLVQKLFSEVAAAPKNPEYARKVVSPGLSVIGSV